MISRSQVKPPVPLFIHCDQEAPHSLQPTARSAALLVGQVAVADARPTDWCQTSLADALVAPPMSAPAMSTIAPARDRLRRAVMSLSPDCVRRGPRRETVAARGSGVCRLRVLPIA